MEVRDARMRRRRDVHNVGVGLGTSRGLLDGELGERGTEGGEHECESGEGNEELHCDSRWRELAGSRLVRSSCLRSLLKKQ